MELFIKKQNKLKWRVFGVRAAKKGKRIVYLHKGPCLLKSQENETILAVSIKMYTPRAATQLEWKKAKSAIKIAHVCREPGAISWRHQCLDFNRVLISSPAATGDQHQQIILDVTGEKERGDPGHQSGYTLLGRVKPGCCQLSQCGGEGHLVAAISVPWARALPSYSLLTERWEQASGDLI